MAGEAKVVIQLRPLVTLRTVLRFRLAVTLLLLINHLLLQRLQVIATDKLSAINGNNLAGPSLRLPLTVTRLQPLHLV